MNLLTLSGENKISVVLKYAVCKYNKHNLYCVWSWIQGQNLSNWMWTNTADMMLINCHYTPTPLGNVLGFDIFLHKQHSIVCKKYIGHWKKYFDNWKEYNYKKAYLVTKSDFAILGYKIELGPVILACWLASGPDVFGQNLTRPSMIHLLSLLI